LLESSLAVGDTMAFAGEATGSSVPPIASSLST
jgi:hypothetical protein